MYCNKLKEILSNEDSNKYGIDIYAIKKLDLYLRNNVTIDELDRLNPAKFSLETELNFDITLKLFYICKKVGLFEPIAYYKCGCGESFRIYSLSNQVNCPNGCSITPENDKERIYVYFKLTCELEDCDFINYSKYMSDIIDDDDLGKGFASYPDFVKAIGDTEASSLIDYNNDFFKKRARNINAE